MRTTHAMAMTTPMNAPADRRADVVLIVDDVPDNLAVLHDTLDGFGLLGKLVAPLLHRARPTGRLFASVVATALGLNVAAGDQYIALLLPTRLYSAEFARRGLAPENLSRAAGDAGIVTSALVPWNSCGAYMAVVLGVPTMAYLPFAVFNYAAPLLTLLLGFTGWRIARLPVAPVPARGDGHRLP